MSQSAPRPRPDCVCVCVFKGPSELHKAKVTYSAKNVHASCVMTATCRLSICGACVDLTRWFAVTSSLRNHLQDLSLNCQRLCDFSVFWLQSEFSFERVSRMCAPQSRLKVEALESDETVPWKYVWTSFSFFGYLVRRANNLWVSVRNLQLCIFSCLSICCWPYLCCVSLPWVIPPLLRHLC